MAGGSFNVGQAIIEAQDWSSHLSSDTVKSYMKKHISVHRTDATLLATNVDWKTCRVDSACLFVVLTQTGESKKGGIRQNSLYPIDLEHNRSEKSIKLLTVPIKLKRKRNCRRCR